MLHSKEALMYFNIAHLVEEKKPIMISKVTSSLQTILTEAKKKIFFLKENQKRLQISEGEQCLKNTKIVSVP